MNSVENYENQLLNSGDFSSGEIRKNQETPDQFRRFGHPEQECKEHGATIIVHGDRRKMCVQVIDLLNKSLEGEDEGVVAGKRVVRF